MTTLHSPRWLRAPRSKAARSKERAALDVAIKVLKEIARHYPTEGYLEREKRVAAEVALGRIEEILGDV